jgi:hypothetical protein
MDDTWAYNTCPSSGFMPGSTTCDISCDSAAGWTYVSGSTTVSCGADGVINNQPDDVVCKKETTCEVRLSRCITAGAPYFFFFFFKVCLNDVDVARLSFHRRNSALLAGVGQTRYALWLCLAIRPTKYLLQLCPNHGLVFLPFVTRPPRSAPATTSRSRTRRATCTAASRRSAATRSAAPSRAALLWTRRQATTSTRAPAWPSATHALLHAPTATLALRPRTRARRRLARLPSSATRTRAPPSGM